jgi:hypothetical protein
MARYRNDGTMPLNYSDSGGPFVQPGEEFEHDIPPAQLESHLRSGFLSLVREEWEPSIDVELPKRGTKDVRGRN